MQRVYPGKYFSNIFQVVLFALACASSSLSAQSFYSVRPDYLKKKSSENLLLQNYRNAYPDTNISNYANYAATNFLGNTGLSSAPYFFQPSVRDLGFIYFRPFLNNDRIAAKDVQFYRSVGPYADLTGVAGSGQLQMFRLLFTVTPANKANVTLRLNRYTNVGFYKRQGSLVNNVYLSSNYETKNRRFGYYFYVLNNTNYNSENGGLAQGQLTDTTVLEKKNILPINLSQASRDDRETRVMLSPYLRLGSKNDSANKYENLLQLQTQYVSQSFKYTDINSSTDGYYANFYHDTLKTKDSSHVQQFDNGLNYVLRKRDGAFGISLGIRNEISKVWQFSQTQKINNIAQVQIAHRMPLFAADTAGIRKGLLTFNGQAQQVIQGSNAGDVLYKLQSELSPNIKKSSLIYFSLAFENRHPDHMYLAWDANNFNWKNDFRQQQKTEFNLGLKLFKSLSLQLFQQNIHNYLYFDSAALPQQHLGMLLNSGVSLAFTKVFFKHLGIGLEHRFQQTNKAAIIRFPQNYSKINLFYGGSLFKNNLQLNIGAQVQIYQSFSPYAYMPSTQIFYLQNQLNTGAYPYCDFYISGRIRPVSFFLKMENVLRELAGTNYFLVSGYYQPERAFRMGITWTFFD